MAVGRRGREPISGASAASDADVSEAMGRRADESVTRCTLEIETPGTDAGARGMAGAWSLAIGGGAGVAPSARRCTMGRSPDRKSRAGDDVALSWTVGVVGCRSSAEGSSRADVRASGSSNRGGSVASGEGASSVPGDDVLVCLTPVARSIGAFVLGARSRDARAGTATSAGTRCTRAASFGTI